MKLHESIMLPAVKPNVIRMWYEYVAPALVPGLPSSRGETATCKVDMSRRFFFSWHICVALIHLA